MASATPRRSVRIPLIHTPKMSERKKALFQTDNAGTTDSLTKHRRLPVLDSDTDSEDCDLGIISALDRSSSDELNDQDSPRTPEKNVWHGTRSNTSKILKENQNLKHFIKSPFTLNKYQTLYDPKESQSTPATPYMESHPGTPSSTHSCTSAYTSSSDHGCHSRARKNLASFIADTESCSSSLKDLTFDSDSGTDSKENTPAIRKSSRKKKYTPKFASFKGILQQQKQVNTSPVTIVSDLDDSVSISPTQILKTPQNQPDSIASPPKIRKTAIEIAESPEDCYDSETSHKRLRNDSITSEGAPSSKYLKLDPSTAPKARLSLFNSERLKEILSVKSFYGKSNLDLQEPANNVINKIENAVIASASHMRRPIPRHSRRRKNRKPGQINMGVHHKIRKPNVRNKGKVKVNPQIPAPTSTIVSPRLNETIIVKNSLQSDLDFDKTDPFSSEKQTIAALLSQWTEEDVPENELVYVNKENTTELACFNATVMEESNPIFPPVSAVPVVCENVDMGDGSVLVELGVNQSEIQQNTELMPIEGTYIVLEENNQQAQEDMADLVQIEQSIQQLDEEILRVAQNNNIDAGAVIASTEFETSNQQSSDSQPKLFPIFSTPDTGLEKARSKGTMERSRKPILKSMEGQYVIDAGQKRFGATQCPECGVIYEIGDPQDEHDHLIHHNSVNVLKFIGWKEERVVGRWDDGRCICVRGTEPGWKRVATLLSRLVHPQLGYSEQLPNPSYIYTAYLYIERKEIIGCLVAEPKAMANKFIPGDPDCCSNEEYPVKCGISRIWTHSNARRRGIAVRMLECARASFLHGCAITRADVAFSAPTASGKALATAYTGTEQFYIYLI